MKEPSEKQVCFAKDIFAITAVPLPEEFSAKAYWKYIDENVDEFYRKYQTERKREPHVMSEIERRIAEGKERDRILEIWGSLGFYRACCDNLIHQKDERVGRGGYDEDDDDEPDEWW